MVGYTHDGVYGLYTVEYTHDGAYTVEYTQWSIPGRVYPVEYTHGGVYARWSIQGGVYTWWIIHTVEASENIGRATRGNTKQVYKHWANLA